MVYSVATDIIRDKLNIRVKTVCCVLVGSRIVDSNHIRSEICPILCLFNDVLVFFSDKNHNVACFKRFFPLSYPLEVKNVL